MSDTLEETSDEELLESLPNSDDTIEPAAASPNYLSEAAIDFLCQIGSPLATIPVQPERTVLIGPCGGCQRDLPWPTPRPGTWASPVSCPQCKRWYYSECYNEAKPGMNHLCAGELSRIKQIVRNVFTLHQSKAVSPLFNQLFGDAYLGNERRRKTRIVVSRPVVTIPLDSEAVPIGKAEQQTLVDLSQEGMGLLATTGTTSPLMLIDFSRSGTPGLQLLTRVVRRESKEGFTRTGCELLHQPDDPMPLH